jgi:non-heme chloroperoxidase
MIAAEDTLVLRRTPVATGVTLESIEHRSTSGTPVILLHGVTDSWRSFEHLLPHLPRSLRAIAATQRGHGNSSKPATYHYGEMAADIAALLDALQIPSAVIVGHSMGGQVALRLALDHPSRVRGLVLLASFHTLRAHEVIQELWSEGIGAMRDPIDPAFVRAFQEGTVATPIPAAQMDVFVGESLKVPARVWQATFREFLDEDFQGELGRIAAPTLVVSGGKDPLSRAEERTALLASIPGATAIDYPEQGHAVHWEQPAAIARDIARLVERLPATPAARTT